MNELGACSNWCQYPYLLSKGLTACARFRQQPARVLTNMVYSGQPNLATFIELLGTGVYTWNYVHKFTPVFPYGFDVVPP